MQQDTTYNESDAERTTSIEASAQIDEQNARELDQKLSTEPPVKVLDVLSLAEGEIACGLLETEGIAAYFEQFPDVTFSTGVMLGAAYHGGVFVSPSDESQAREIIAAFAQQPVNDEEVEAG